MTSESLGSVLLAPPGRESLPPFDDGWRGENGEIQPFLSYVEHDHAVNWSKSLEALHEESSRTHALDVWTRGAMLSRLGATSGASTIVDLGCSTGYLLEDLRTNCPGATLIGVDLVGSGLRKAHASHPGAYLVQADVCALPIADTSLDAIVCANVLEHVPDDFTALSEVRRVLRPQARAVLVVPAGAGIYDYYDRFLGHERRYEHGELARKAREARLEVLEDIHLGALLFPMFWLVKRRNRLCFDHLQGAAVEARVTADINRTRDSRSVRLACRAEQALLAHGVRLPFGIRSLVVVRRPASDS